VNAPAGSWRADVARIAPLAWPVLVGQIAVLMYATVDTVLVARFAAADLAALAVGGAAYITVFIGLVGIVMALGPLVGQLYGAGRHADAGAQLHQAVWLALALTLVGSTLLAQRPRWPPRCAATCSRWPSRCRPRCCSRPTAVSTSRCRGRRR
jgi:multidrug resistance protein, MATE family